jgi:hypothetical protein
MKDQETYYIIFWSAANRFDIQLILNCRSKN